MILPNARTLAAADETLVRVGALDQARAVRGLAAELERQQAEREKDLALITTLTNDLRKQQTVIDAAQAYRDTRSAAAWYQLLRALDGLP